jgi:hypothetical protein
MKKQRLSLRLEELESRLVPTCTSIPSYALALVPDSAVTDTALGGNWSDPASWSNGVPGAADNVLIPNGITEIVDAVVQAVHTIRVDGELDFAPSANTGLTVDTLVVNEQGTFNMGTAAAPIAAGYTANLTFSDDGPIDTSWDPLLFSRGLLSCGTVNIVGQQTTSIVGWSGSHSGDSSLTLSGGIPTGWQVGDLIEFEGTSALVNQDEESTITSLSGNTVGFATPLAYDHLPPDPSLQVYAADDTRNVVIQSANPADAAGHGQIMFFSTAVNIQYAKFSSLGRTNKLLPVTTPTLDATDQVIAGSTANPRDRDPVHFLDAGTESAATVNGSLVEDSPGWGWVNQGSYVNFTNDVACGTVGAGFVAENGNELGTFTNCLAMRETGDGTESDSRKEVDIFGNHLAGSKLGDFGHEGVGFWVEGPGVSLINNVSTGAAGEAYNVYTHAPLDPYTGTVSTFDGVKVTDGVLAQDSGNLAYGSRDGFDLLYHRGKAGTSTIDSFTAWNISRNGVQILYAAHVIFQNSWILGYSSSPGLVPYGVHLGIEAMDDLTFTNDRIEYCAIGLHTAPLGHMYVHGGYFNDLTGVDVRMPNTDNGLSLTIDGAFSSAA